MPKNFYALLAIGTYKDPAPQFLGPATYFALIAGGLKYGCVTLIGSKTPFLPLLTAAVSDILHKYFIWC